MKRVNHLLKYNIALVAALLLVTSCQKLDLAPYDRDTDLNYWKKPESALYSVNKCYQGMNNADEVLYADAMTDNAYTKVPNTHNQAVGNGSFSTADSYIASVWDYRYAGIRQCNLLLNNIQQVPGLSDELRNRYTGEATFIRVYHYFELYSRFGDIPYFTNVLSMNESKSIARMPKAEVVNKLLADLSGIIDNNYLPPSYDSQNTGRITRWAAMGLKARILMFEGRYAEVSPITNAIMTNGGFSLFNSYEGLFLVQNENNPEVLLDIQYLAVDREHNIQYNFLPPSLGGYSQLSPLQELVDDYITLDGYPVKNAPAGSYNPSNPFNNRDPRLAATIIYNGNSYKMADGTDHVVNTSKNASPDGFGFSSDASATGYYLKKYWDNSYRANLMSGLNIILMRYADILLMHAEALAEQGRLDAAEWDRTIRLIRQRAGFSDSRALSFPGSDNLVSIVRRERRCELAMEGLRHKDIIRWKIAENVMNGWVHGLYTGDAVGTDNGYVRVENRKFDPAKDYLWPIPQKDRDLNSNLTQNPKW
ncbi:RagB/SusD family nutrient uptake outer membrane protein [Pararcticibacter amylolyticus]|uniref:RagB/SusD family nutrient uptake outer membrane protein n=1 Tax=Pararcticibacter amylolyticus TaxID=2173175 RepID=A0A2U2PBM2_9SPHI|nr:RagB/SusD family nutrient uptake outer membrane protein [Pararcticibacter amylolyticus]PWG78755.1 RagB/SusD family nutrient uptake outer membrane protein [Pararcticibacter amylolyticus]